MSLDPKYAVWFNVFMAVVASLASAGWQMVLDPTTAAHLSFALMQLLVTLNAIAHALPAPTAKP